MKFAMKEMVFAFILLMSLIAVSAFAGAENLTVITGKVYNSSAFDHNFVAGAQVSASCGSQEAPIIEQDTQSDGGYLIQFPSNVCGPDSVVTITANKGSATGTGTGVVRSCTIYPNLICDENTTNLGIVNFYVTEPTPTPTPEVTTYSGGGGGGGGVVVITKKNLTNNVTYQNFTAFTNVSDNGNESADLSNEQTDEGASGFSGITGAFIGPGSAGSWVILIAVIVVIIVAYVYVRKRVNANGPATE